MPSLSNRRNLLVLPELDLSLTKVDRVKANHDTDESVAPVESSGEQDGFESIYRTGEVLGSGTVSVVRIATRKSDGERVAAKCICNEDEEVRRSTRAEYELVSSLSHDSIIRFSGLYETRCKQTIAMEFCSEGSVETYVRRKGCFSEASARPLMQQLFRGVNYLHEKRIVHRDVKPANLLLHRGASLLKICDFNSAKVVGNDDGSSLMLTDRGTHLYSAPELRFGRQWNERIDIWTSGLSSYFMLRKKLPFNVSDSCVKADLIAERRPSMDWRGITKPMQHFIGQCLIVNMFDRPPAMELLMHPILVGAQLAVKDPLRTQSCMDLAAPKRRRTSGFTCASLADSFILHPISGLLCLALGSQRLELSGNSTPRSQSDDEGTLSDWLSPPPLPPAPAWEAKWRRKRRDSTLKMLDRIRDKRHSMYLMSRDAGWNLRSLEALAVDHQLLWRQENFREPSFVGALCRLAARKSSGLVDGEAPSLQQSFELGAMQEEEAALRNRLLSKTGMCKAYE